MLKKQVTYTDFNDNEVTEEFHFHLSKAELIEMEAATRGGLGAYLDRIVKTNDGGAIIQAFKDLLMKSVGRVSEDGKRFIKDDEVRNDFQQSPAYSELFMELATDAGAAAEFVNGIIPQGLDKTVAEIGEVPKPPQRKREQTETVPVAKQGKQMTRAAASHLSAEELQERIADGWVIIE